MCAVGMEGSGLGGVAGRVRKDLFDDARGRNARQQDRSDPVEPQGDEWHGGSSDEQYACADRRPTEDRMSPRRLAFTSVLVKLRHPTTPGCHRRNLDPPTVTAPSSSLDRD